MKAAPDALLAAFAEAYGAGLDHARAAGAVEALLAEQARLAAVPTEDMIRTRRLENVAGPVFARARRELRVTREQLASADSADAWLVEQRDMVALWLLEAGISVRAVAALVNRERASVRDAAARARARLAAAGASTERRASHG